MMTQFNEQHQQQSETDNAELLEWVTLQLENGRAVDFDSINARFAGPGKIQNLTPLVMGLRSLKSNTEVIAGQVDDFLIHRRIGQGGMGDVYIAEQLSLSRTVALKVLPVAMDGGDGRVTRFRREARITASLIHSHIPPVYSLGCERGVNFYAMQYVDGPNLSELLAANHEAAVAAESISRDTIQWCLQIAEALHHIHERGVIHRDVKPSNLLIARTGTIWLTDFGLAIMLGESEAIDDAAGTLKYMSPEQIRGDAALDIRTDIYSLGVTLFEVVTGRAPFSATRYEELVNTIVQGESDAPRCVCPWIPVELEAIILRAMKKERQARYQSADQMADDLRRFLNSTDIKPSLSVPPASEKSVESAGAE